MKPKTNEITLTAREINDLAKAANLVPHGSVIEADDAEVEYTIFEREGGVPIGDENGNNPKLYAHGAYITEYHEEGSFPLGEPICTPEA